MGDKAPLMGPNKDDDADDLNLDDNNKSNNNNGRWKMILSCAGVVILISLGVAIGAKFSTLKKSSIIRDARFNRKVKFPYDDIRLPGNVIPLNYRIYLHPNITDGKFGFTGNVRILVQVKHATDSIILHSKHLKLLTTEVFEGASNMEPENDYEKKTVRVKVMDTLRHKKHEMYMVQLGITLSENKTYVIHIKFAGSLSTGLEGFYKSSYKTKSGEKRYLATTHFEATGARSAFPCFDEPAMKAKFTIIMVRERMYTALSNMPVEKEVTRKDGLLVSHFEESVKMSTYLVAFIVSDYTSLNATTKRGIKVKVWAPKDQIMQARFAIQAAPKILDYYEEFFKVDFPLPKQDLIAIPDFAAGAMENWGLITYRLTSILYDEKESSSSNKQWVAVVIAHELAHQWFGNLVTMQWWNDLWLNEGFASFVEFIGANLVNPKWQMMDQFVIDSVQNSLALDSHLNSHPISVPVKDPSQINEIFDTISYDKGSSIIRMLKDFIGSKAFHSGLENYLQKYKFGNAISDNLWECFSQATADDGQKINVKSVMDTWTLQMGYPVINVFRDSKDKETAIVTQEHFITDVKDESPAAKKSPKAKDDKPSPFGYKWEVPLTFYFQHNRQKKREWFHRNDENVKISWNRMSGWMKVNADQIGFYRVNYDEENWKALANQLKRNHTALSDADRANIIDDAFELAKADKMTQVQALELTEYLKNEKEYVPFVSAISSLGYIGGMLLTRPGYKIYEKYMVQQVLPLVHELGWEDKGTHLEKYLRGAVLRNAVFHNDSESVKTAKKMFNDWMINNKRIPANLRSTIYLAGIKYGGQQEWDYMYEKFESSQFPSEQRKLMFSLTETSDPKILKQYLEATLDEEVIRSQDTCSVIEHIAGNPVGTKMAMKFVKKNWKILYKRYGTGSFDISSLVKSTFGSVKTKAGLKDAEHFLTTHQLGSGKLAAKQALAAIRNHIKWLEKNEKSVVQWLRSKMPLDK